MVTKILKVVAQTQAVYVPSKKSDNGQLARVDDQAQGAWW